MNLVFHHDLKKFRKKNIVIFHLGNHVLYWSFDTLDNFTTNERTEQVNFDPRVTGQVLGVHVSNVKL